MKNIRPSCRICGKTGHSESACFHNEGATCPVAIGRAPFSTPLHRKHNPNASGSQPPPRNGGRRKSTSSGSARALAASSSTTSERECEQALAGTLGRCGLLAEDCGGKGFDGYYRIARSPRRSRHLSYCRHSNLLAHEEQHRQLRNYRSSRRTTTAPRRPHPTLRRAHHERHSQIAVATNRHHAPNQHRSLFARQSHFYLPTPSWTSAIDPLSARRALQRRLLERCASTSRRSPSRSRFRRRRRRQAAKHRRDA